MATAAKTAGEDQRAAAANALLGDAVFGVPYHAGFPLIVQPADPALATDRIGRGALVRHTPGCDRSRAGRLWRDHVFATSRSTRRSIFAGAMECYPSPPGGYSGGRRPR